jgi:predicted Zn-dependent protease
MNGHAALYSRRSFLVATSASALAAATGCATNPVSGRKEFNLLSDADEIELDKEAAPHQFSADYGAVSNARLNAYLTEVGQRLATQSHRPQMPYSFRAVNAVYVNGYTFPAGSVAITRGLLVSLQNEAQLAALLGHELGHVNYRHTARAMSRGMLYSLLLGAISATLSDKYADLAAGLGGLGAGLALASYSRDNEREADAIGMDYMVRTGANPLGMVQLMEVLVALNDKKPSALDVLFATHPMSTERLETTREKIQSDYPSDTQRDLFRERYLDEIAPLRRIKPALDAFQHGEELLVKKKFVEARSEFDRGLKLAPDDYAGLLLSAKCCLVQNDFPEATRIARVAQSAYPGEPQAHHVAGIALAKSGRFEPGMVEFDRYAALLPGNPFTVYYQGFCNEGLQRREPAAQAYHKFLQQVDSGEEAKHAYQKLVEWGYIKKPQKK